MPIDKGIPKWITASLATHFSEAITELPVIVSGSKMKTDDLSEYCEIRVDGPNILEVSHEYWRVYAEINVLITSVIDKNAYKIERLCGDVVSAFTSGLKIYKYGNTLEDDASLVMCMTRIDEERDFIKLSHFGQIETGVDLEQSTVEAHYVGYLKG